MEHMPVKRFLLLLTFLLVNASFFVSRVYAQETPPDTVTVGIYVTSVHDIDFRQKEYSINMWLWLKYTKAEFDFMKNLEVPMAKKFEKSYATVDTLEDGRIYVLMKLECLMKGTWNIRDFPFDRQKLRFGIENSMYDSKALVFVADTFGEHYGKYFLMEWEKDSFHIATDVKKYETAFGDASLTKPHSEYSTYKVVVSVHRHSWELFFKLFIGMYISFLISCVCFYIHPDNMDSRLTLSVGSIFAVIGNKYIIDSALPESNSFSLVDMLHGITLFYVFLVILCSVHTLRLIKADKQARAERFNTIAGNTSLAVYVILNALLIYGAYNAVIIE
jgi:hypothetical protein